MIVGAGLAGLIAAHVFQRETIYEAAAEPRQMHQALLRFRSDVVSKLTGIEFRKVRVRKGIYFEGEFVAPNIAFANAYSQKCMGKLVGERSIWNLDPVDRYVAPENFYEQMIDAIKDRIVWGCPFDFRNARKEPVISTAPLPVVLKQLGACAPDRFCGPIEFKFAPITVIKMRLKEADVHQTVYFPSNEHSMYRASITGDLLICEFAGEARGPWDSDLGEAFCIYGAVRDGIRIDAPTTQTYGKIAPIDEDVRKEMLHGLTQEQGIFSIGRFATWRNILLDDVVNDAAVVKRLIAGSNYERRKALL